jgi:hypothetical protein
MKIVGIEGMTVQQLQDAVARGGRFVIYQYCFSIIVMSFRRGSDVHFVPPGTSAAKKGAQYIAASLLAGWWGIPWGPIWTLSTVFKNLGGGVDVTRQVLAQIAPAQPVVAAPAAIRPAPL